MDLDLLFVNFYATTGDSSEIKMRKSFAMYDNTVWRASSVQSVSSSQGTALVSSAVYTFSI